MNNNLAKRDLSTFHRRLHRWYKMHGRRDLPWRKTNDAYAIYVSEIMLQQTQVKTVLERYYRPFLKRFPTLEALARASQKEVLKVWEGLGYYNRAINMHETAKRCSKELPKTVEGLLALPGIGQNTAHAVAAFAYKIQVPVLEANVKRLLMRLSAQKTPLSEQLWRLADTLLDRKNPFDYNQAMMDLGALLCTKRAPRCTICPANGICEGKSAPELYPAQKQKKSLPVRKQHIIVWQNPEGQYFAVPRKGKFLNGLYCFIEQDKPHKNAHFLGAIRQQYSHFTLEADVHLLQKNARGKNWYDFEELKKLPFSNAEKRILTMLATQYD